MHPEEIARLAKPSAGVAVAVCSVRRRAEAFSAQVIGSRLQCGQEFGQWGGRRRLSTMMAQPAACFAELAIRADRVAGLELTLKVTTGEIDLALDIAGPLLVQLHRLLGETLLLPAGRVLVDEPQYLGVGEAGEDHLPGRVAVGIAWGVAGWSAWCIASRIAPSTKRALRRACRCSWCARRALGVR